MCVWRSTRPGRTSHGRRSWSGGGPGPSADPSGLSGASAQSDRPGRSGRAGPRGPRRPRGIASRRPPAGSGPAPAAGTAGRQRKRWHRHVQSSSGERTLTPVPRGHLALPGLLAGPESSERRDEPARALRHVLRPSGPDRAADPGGRRPERTIGWGITMAGPGAGPGVVDGNVYERAVRRFREARIVMPTFAAARRPRLDPRRDRGTPGRASTPTRPTR